MVFNDYLSGRTAAPHRKTMNVTITTREREILSLLAEGKTSKQIATSLGISIRTVESHRIHINRKLGFGSVAELVRYAIRHGLVSTN